MSQDSTDDTAAAAPGWAIARRGRLELTAAGLFLLVFAVVPLCTTEFFPFSQAPMFADAPWMYCDYAVTGPIGEPLALHVFALQRNYWGNPLGVGVGFEPPASLDEFGEVPPKLAVTEWLQNRLAGFPHLEFVDVTRTVIGAVDDRQVGPIHTERWRVDNLHYQGSAQ